MRHLIAVLAVFGFASPALALDNVVRYVTTAELATITYDGDISDWETILGVPPVVNGDFKTCCSDDGTTTQVVPDIADLEVEGVWVAWNDQTDMIYVVARVKDNISAKNDDPFDLGSSWIGDGIEIFIDGDNSGGNYQQQGGGIFPDG